MSTMLPINKVVESVSITHKFDKPVLKFLNTSDVENGKIININHLPIDELKGQAKKTIQKHDILFSEIRPKNRRFAYVDIDDTYDYVVSTKLMVLRNINPEVDNKYFYYFLTNDHMLSILQDRAENRIGSFPQITFDLLSEYYIRVPKLAEQQKIASVLSALDSKIELNNRINAELEAMAKTLYDYWFVQFDFPDAEGKPYKTSGGKMHWNERLKREIPEEWQNLTLGEVVASTGTGLNPRDNFVLGEGNNFYVTIKNIEQGRVVLDNKCDKISDQSLEIINKRSDLRIGDILFTSIEPVGITYLILEKPKNWNINESVFTIRPDYERVTSEFLFMFLSGDYIKSYTKNVSAGSIHKGIRHSLLKDCQFILPERNTVDEFTLKVQPILKKLDLIQKENQKLIELRDWLLPMLMNGQVKVKDEKETELSMAAEPATTYKKSRT